MHKKRVIIGFVMILVSLLFLTKDQFYASYPYLPYTSTNLPQLKRILLKQNIEL